MKDKNLLLVLGVAAVALFLLNQNKASAAPKVVKLPTNFNQLPPAAQQQYIEMLQHAQTIDGSIYE